MFLKRFNKKFKRNQILYRNKSKESNRLKKLQKKEFNKSYKNTKKSRQVYRRNKK